MARTRFFAILSRFHARLRLQFGPKRRFVIAKSALAAKPAVVAEASKLFAIDAARMAANTRCDNVVVLDVRGISPITDYMVLATGTSARQMRTVCDDIADMAAEKGNRALARDGTDGELWMLIDFVDVVVHVFNAEARQFYDLDSLWGDAAKVEWKQS